MKYKNDAIILTANRLNHRSQTVESIIMQY